MLPPWEDCERPHHSLFQHLLVQSELDSGHSGDNGDRDSLPPSTAARDGFDSCSGAEVNAGVDDNAVAAAAAGDADHHASLGAVHMCVRAIPGRLSPAGSGQRWATGGLEGW